QPLLHQRRSDHPRIVGELQHFAADRTGEGQREFLGKLDLRAPAELLPGELETAMLRGLERDRLAKRHDAVAVDRGKGEAGVGPADVGHGELPHAPSATIAASIADAPASAWSTCSRIIANSSRPVPMGGGGELAAGREARSTFSASSVPERSPSRITSPSRTRASGPSGSASGET